MAKTQNAINFSATTNTQLAIGLTTAGPNGLDVDGAVAIGNGFAGTATAPTNGVIVEGNVGFGSNSPTALLELASTSTNGTFSAMAVQNFNSTAAAGKGSAITFQTKDNGGTTRAQGNLRFATSATNAQENFVGIATTNTSGFSGTGVSFSAGDAMLILPNGTAIFPSGFTGMGSTYSARGYAGTGLEIGYDRTNNASHIVGITEPSTWRTLAIRAQQVRYFLPGNTTGSFVILPKGADPSLPIVGIGIQTPINALELNGGCAVGSGYAGSVTAPDNSIIISGTLSANTNSFSCALNLRTGTIFSNTTPGSFPYNVNSTTDYIISVSTIVARSIVLPTAASANRGLSYFVKDIIGNAGANPITVTVNGGGNIDGAASNTINTNYGSREFYSNGTQWFTKG